MGIIKMSNGFYTFSDNHLKSRTKKDLINYIRTIEKNWQNALITNDIQYNNCKRLLAEERSKAIDEFAERLKEKDKHLTVNERIINEIAEQLKGGSDD